MTCIVGTKYMFFFVLFYKCVNGVILLWEKKPCSTSYSHTFVKIRCTNEVCFLLSVFSTFITLSSPYLYIRSFSGVIGWNDKLKWIVCAIKYDVNTHTTPSSKYIKKKRVNCSSFIRQTAHTYLHHIYYCCCCYLVDCIILWANVSQWWIHKFLILSLALTAAIEQQKNWCYVFV